MATIVETLKVIYRDTSGEEPDSIPKIAIGPRGEPITDKKPVRSNDFVLGVDTRGKLLLAYIKGSKTQGFHGDPEAYIVRVMGRDRIVAALHGSVYPEGNGNHSLSIYKIHPADINTAGGNEKLKEESLSKPWEMGRFSPESFVTDLLAQRLMHTLDATRLEIVFAMRSREIYSIPPISIGTVPAATNYQIAGG